MVKTIQLILMQIVKIMFWLKFIINSNLLVLEVVFLQILFNIVFEHVFFFRDAGSFFHHEIFYLHSCLMSFDTFTLVGAKLSISFSMAMYPREAPKPIWLKLQGYHCQFLYIFFIIWINAVIKSVCYWESVWKFLIFLGIYELSCQFPQKRMHLLWVVFNFCLSFWRRI